MVGGWSYAVVTTTTWGLHEGLGVSEKMAFATGIVLALIINIFLLKMFVFRSAKGYWETGSRFVLTSVLIRGGEFLLFVVLLRFGTYYLLASTLAMFVGASIKYIVLKMLVYK